ncbi:hypothetical protein Nepgr_008234 [Nepenthes gracilis]|uniref:Uncharacterized protein n=1 Tax=Nepenthes gracilis TaxID=150966 RepID=A0AAD3S8H6_NEPGR|nr:hypothetical protein Nepgr_008234 [Nepenthes gracilis]
MVDDALVLGDAEELCAPVPSPEPEGSSKLVRILVVPTLEGMIREDILAALEVEVVLEARPPGTKLGLPALNAAEHGDSLGPSTSGDLARLTEPAFTQLEVKQLRGAVTVLEDNNSRLSKDLRGRLTLSEAGLVLETCLSRGIASLVTPDVPDDVFHPGNSEVQDRSRLRNFLEETGPSDPAQ